MALFVSCDCGARFEVADTFASQSVSCPECPRSVKVPAVDRVPLRTSGYAVASIVLALVGMFTVVFTAVAMALGVIALVSIRRHRNQVTGAGYAVCGIVLGFVFTSLTLFALSRDEIFERVREQLAAGQYDYTGPLEIIRERDGFAITRPSPRWGVARDQPLEEGFFDDGLILANVAKDTFVQVTVEEAEPNESLEKCRDDVVASFRDTPRQLVLNKKQLPLRTTGFKVRESRRLPSAGQLEIAEVLLDLRLSGQPMTYLIRVCKPHGSARAYVVSGWTHQHRFPEVEDEIRQALDSFHLLK